jgi:hypothetical protein
VTGATTTTYAKTHDAAAASMRQPGAASKRPAASGLHALGNQALQRLFAAGAIRAKLEVSQPGDPDEQEADRIAEQVVSGARPQPVRQSCAACSAGGATCPKCEQEHRVRRKEARGHAPQQSPPLRSQIPALRGGGQPLAPSVRAFFEPRFGVDFSRVRVHNDSQAHESARVLQAKAFTLGQDIVLGAGQFAPESPDGRRLLAHEMAHTLQPPGDRTSVTLRRAPLDPANPNAWDWYGSEAHRKDPSFLQTVAAAPGAAKDAQQKLATAQVPTTEEEREAFEQRALALIRLNAVAMVGQHRGELAARKKQFEDMAANPQPTAGPASSVGGGANPKAADTAAAIRTAAQTVTRLSAEKSLLEELRDAIAGAVRVNAGPEAIDEEYQTLWAKAQPSSVPWALQRLLETRNRLHGGGLAWGSKKVVLMDLRNDLRKLREKQIQGIDLSLALTYNSFPFLADLKATWIETGKEDAGTSGKVKAFGLGLASTVVPGLAPYAAWVAHDVFRKDAPPDDQTLLRAVGASFERLLQNTDEAIVKVGSGGIHPLDLPGAVAAARGGLPEALRPELDRLKDEHEAAKFAAEMIMALGIAVLTGLSGGLAGVGLAAYATGAGVAAAGVGVAQLGSQLKDMLDRQTLAAASTNPEGTLLGVSAPNLFEWTMFGVAALLTAADLAVLAREIRALKPAFNEEAHLPTAKSEPHGGASAEGEPAKGQRPSDPAGTPDTSALEPGQVKPANAAEARILEGGKGDAVPSVEQIDSEMAVVQRAEPKKIPGKDYVEEVELPNGHTWRRTSDGHWCRFSNGRICVPAVSGKTAGSTVRSIEDLDKLVEPLRPKLDRPPASVRTPEDQSMWELYHDYFSERVASMRSDFQATGQTKRELPRDFDSFRKQYTENPELIKALRGRLAQGETGNIISDITSGKVTQNLGISRVPNPGPGEVVYPDFVWSGRKGYTAVSNKSRDFRGMSRSQIKKTVMADVDEALKKYHGTRYVRRPGLDVTGQPIEIDEVILNYDPRLIPEDVQPDIFAYAKEHGGGGVEVGFFGFR